MKVTKDELQQFGLYESLPQPIKEMVDGDYFAFFYNEDEENLKLQIFDYQIVKQINLSLYRGMTSKEGWTPLSKVGFFSNTFETKDGLFYQFLRTYNTQEKVKLFYSFAVEQDKIVELNVSTDAVNNIRQSEDFRRAISYFAPNRIQTIMFVYDMVNEAIQQRLSKSLYGDMIKKVVNLVKFDGGVLPEMGGYLRFMVIGQHADLTDIQKERLEEAKLLVRSLQDLDKVYSYTGWALSSRDGKWRTNIADNEAHLKNALFVENNGRNLYVPSGNNIEDVLNLIKNPANIYSSGYKGRLIDVLSHPTLFQYYPRLALLPLIYNYGQNKSGGQEFYFNKNDRGGYIVINGSKLSGDSLSILLHEIQHYIQSIEGYATGGNQFFAQFVASVGSSSVRTIFACINRMEKYVRENLDTDESRIQIIQVIENQLAKTNESRNLKNELLKLLNNKEEYKYNFKLINFYLVLFVAEEGDFSTNDVVLYLQKKLGDIVFELFENVKEGYLQAKKYREILTSVEGLRDEDIRNVLFKSYENLYGELESRSTQSSRYVDSEFKNYFYLTKWENSPIQQITVIDGIETIIDSSKIKAAVETKDESYVMHFQKTISCEPILHELAHIVHDALNTLGHSDIIEKEFDKEMIIEDIDEFFVVKFLAYLKENIEDNNLGMDFRLNFSIRSNEKINKLLDEFFAEKSVNERLLYLQTILSL
jgi:hypothetical protein